MRNTVEKYEHRKTYFKQKRNEESVCTYIFSYIENDVRFDS